jgi:hypothetical protein
VGIASASRGTLPLPDLGLLPLTGVPGPRFPAAGSLLAFARTSRLSRRALVGRRPLPLPLQRSIVLLGQESLRLADGRRGNWITGQPDPFAEEIIVDLRIRRGVRGGAFKPPHSAGVVAEEVQYFVVEDSCYLLYRPLRGDGGVIIEPPPPVHGQGPKPRPGHRDKRPEGCSQVRPCSHKLQARGLYFDG